MDQIRFINTIRRKINANIVVHLLMEADARIPPPKSTATDQVIVAVGAVVALWVAGAQTRQLVRMNDKGNTL